MWGGRSRPSRRLCNRLKYTSRATIYLGQTGAVEWSASVLITAHLPAGDTISWSSAAHDQAARPCSPTAHLPSLDQLPARV